MLSDPAQSRFFGDGFLKDRCAVNKHAIAEIANALLDATRELAQSSAQDLVVIPTERIS